MDIFDCQLPIADCRLPICVWTKMTSLLKRSIGNRQLKIENVLAEGAGLEPASDERDSFQDYCLTN
jgi:hypothetical protein